MTRRTMQTSKISMIVAIIFCQRLFVVNGFTLQPSLARSFVTTSQNEITASLKKSSSATLLNNNLNSNEYKGSETYDSASSVATTRRDWFQQQCAGIVASALAITMPLYPSPAIAADSIAAEVTDKVYLDIKGLSPPADGSSSTKRIVIGLFGKASPQSVDKVKKLFDAKGGGLVAPCKPREEGRVLQREQLEANKVYNSCIETQDKGVNYEFSTIWRVLKGERLDMGAVAGKFVARENPTWEEAESTTRLIHDRPGIVSVRKGSDSGFGFTIFPGSKNDGGSSMNVEDLDDNHIIIGQVVEGLDVVEEINNIPVINSAKVNYMALTGGPTTKNAPSRACRYGGAMYCNENKPLIKMTVMETGILK